MGGHTGGGDDGTEAICPGVQSKLPGFLRRPVGRIDVTLVGNAQGFQSVHCLSQDGKIAVAAHDDSNFFHV